MSVARLNKERQQIEKEGYKLLVDDANNNLWSLFVLGPQGSPYEGLQLQLELKLQGFPFKAPIVTMKTNLHHPNITELGEVCDLMIETNPQKWAPANKITGIIKKIESMLVMPDIKEAVNQKAAEDFKQGGWAAKARAIVEKQLK